MNIFALHHQPRKAARWHVDRHVVKMILEYTQLLYTVHWVLYEPAITLPGGKSLAHQLESPFRSAPCLKGTTRPGYRPTHWNHPCAIWARQTIANYRWLVALAMEVAREYRYRFGRVHACEVHVEWLRDHEPPGIRRIPLRTPFACAMPDEIKGEDPIQRYREYYREEKEHLLRYTGRHIPHWIYE